MTSVEELYKACETLAEAWNKAMKICKVRPDHSTCSACIATQEMFNVVDDCGKCKLNTDTYELLQIGTGFWSGDYAIVQNEGKITKVSLNRVYDVKESL